MKKIFILFLPSFLGFYLLPLKGQDFDSYLKIAIENNPELKASEAFYKASLEKTKQIGLEDPKLDVSIYSPAMPRFVGNHLFDINLMQMFPMRGTLKASKNEAKYMAKMEFEKYIDKKMI